ncbi:inositol monophosphatase [Nibricoccus sp. IMCC34717]|uniref:inositol monophosphatase n=1 Tax=Nibricoccus sp. IMCC34717 TaxID=3034021 RepID=UPI00384F7C14
MNFERARRLLCELQVHIRDTLIRARRTQARRFATIAGITAADTIYHIDRISEDAISDWFHHHWPKAWPVRLVMEGIEDDAPLTFPRGTPVARTEWVCILDPIDGTRGLMYDKRSAWILSALAPDHGPRTHLGHIVVAAMTELPVSKQGEADQFSAVRGAGLRASRMRLSDGKVARLGAQLSSSTHFEHGFASFARFFPAGLSWLADLEERFWRDLHGKRGEAGAPVVFNDQYISTGGQLHEILAGHDRMIADLRPFAFRALGLDSALVCHPYDICTALLVEEAGGLIDDGLGRPLRCPLNTTTPVSWVAYANRTLARKARPVFKKLLQS